MNNLPNSLKNKASQYNSLSDSKKESFIDTTYNDYDMSYHEIAEICNTYPNKIRRDAKRLGLEARDKSKAQKAALKTGRQTPPTAGMHHSEDTKVKIGDKMAQTWENLSDAERKYRSQIGKNYWDSLSPLQQENMRKAAGEAIRKTAKNGSKLENFLYEALTNQHFIVEFHKERSVTNQKLQIDLFLPAHNVAIEVDGPSHFLPIWGAERLETNRRSDSQKTGLILTQGWCLIRVRQTKKLSQSYKREIMKRLLESLEQIKKQFPARGKRVIIIGGEQYV